MENFKYRCSQCDEVHEGIPALTAKAPLYYYAIEDRDGRCELSEDTCVIDSEHFFIRGNIEIPVKGLKEPFVWGVWVSLSLASFQEFLAYSSGRLSQMPDPWFGWLSADFLVYPESENLKTKAHPMPDNMRPLIELEPTGHPLAIEQRNGITRERLAEILSIYLHRGA